MDVIIAIDSWKGCLTSSEANEAARRGVLTRWPDAKVQCFPMSDGGEGFLDAVEPTGSYQRVTIDALDPLMRPIKADYLYSPPKEGVGGGLAVIEMAQASGLHLLKPDERNPLVASSYGTGQLIADALQRGVTDIVVGLGGSATSDCGMGMLEALVERGHSSIPQSLNITIATDVTNPLLGPNGATYIFAPQKASPSLSPEALSTMLSELETRSVAFASNSRSVAFASASRPVAFASASRSVAFASASRSVAFALANASSSAYDYSQEPGAGAAGGVGYALMQYYGARRISGAEFIINQTLQTLPLPSARSTDGEPFLIITGEGRADCQTLMGKLPYAILQKAKSLDIPVILLAGQVRDRQALLDAGFSQVLCVNPPDSPLEECIRPDMAATRITETIKHITI